MKGFSWFKAAELCCESGGKLATIQSPAQYDLLKSQHLATKAICKGKFCVIMYKYECLM